MDLFDIVYSEFNKGQRTATKNLVNDVINKEGCREYLVKKHRVSSNKVADMRKFIIHLNKGVDFAFRGVTDYVYRYKFK